MANLRDIRRRISSVHSTRQVTRTMEMVSTAKIRRAQERIEHARPYALAISKILSSVTKASASINHPLLSVREEQKKVTVIAIASDRGQAGAFNSSIINMTEAYMREKKSQGIEVELVACGKKIAAYFRYRGITPSIVLEGRSAAPVYADAKTVAERVIREYSDASTDEVVIIFNRFVNVADQRPESTVLLPAKSEDLAPAEEVKDGAQGVAPEYIFEPSAEGVLQSLLPTYVEALIFRALLESAASEHGARRKAMKAATDNATEMIGTLTRSYNRVRQAAITTEISEIVGGAAALEG